MQVEVFYRLTKDGQKADLVAGRDGKKDQVAILEISPEYIADCDVTPDGGLEFSALRYVEFHARFTDFETVLAVADEIKLAKDEKTAAAIKEREAAALAKIARGHIAKDWTGPHGRPVRRFQDIDCTGFTDLAVIQAVKEFNLEADRLNAEEALREEAAYEAEKVAKAKLAQERSEWIAANGSEHLQLAVGNGYNCQRRYVTERAEAEYPGFVVDFDDNADWKTCACPSPEALAESVAINKAAGKDICRVVWLTSEPLSDEERDSNRPFEDPEREALVISDYLGKYDLVK